MARVRLVDRGRRDRPEAVVRQAAPGSPPPRRRRARTGRRSGRLRESAERRRRDVRRHAQHRPLEHRRRHDRARLAVGERHEAGVHEELPRPLGPLGVGVEHRLLGAWVVRVVGPQDRDVVRVAGRVRGERPHLRVEAVELALAALAELAGVVGEDLALAEDPRVALLAQLPRAVRALSTSSSSRSTNSSRWAAAALAGGPHPLAGGLVLDVLPREVAEVAHAALRRVPAPLHDQRMGERRVEVRDPGLDQRPARPPAARRRHRRGRPRRAAGGGTARTRRS